MNTDEKARLRNLVNEMDDLMKNHDDCAGLAYHVAETIESIIDESEEQEQEA